MKKLFSLFLATFAAVPYLLSQSPDMVTYGAGDRGVRLAGENHCSPLFVDKDADPGIMRAAFTLAGDLEKVTGIRPTVNVYPPSGESSAIIIGTLGESRLVDMAVGQGQLDPAELEGKREKFVIKTVTAPFAGAGQALIIAGSDKRGTIYGIFELSRQIGVSPWHFWADVPVKKQTHLTVREGLYTAGEPAVEFRGIFLNDEAPALTGWVNENFGGYNSKFYIHVFELLQRLKGNFLWPAMWDAAFYDDDPLNSVLAGQMGIVVGTTHHEPMGRAHKEWRRYGTGAWDYQTNRKTLDGFWREGVERMQHTEDFVTLAMRGDGDMPMSEESNIALLERIVANQRKIISEVTGRPADQTPQVWALYKEVQDYYDRGMRVPDDITLFLCDDNWGNVRKLPDPGAPARRGGYGMYYHFDYVGGPRNYKWINVSQVQRIWEQMNICYEFGVKKIWVVNVGDLKPMEYPIQFFLDMAWDPEAFDQNNLWDHTLDFCREQFGGHYPDEAARILDTYAKFNRRVTPELLDWKTYSLHNYNEFQMVTADYRNLALAALRLYHLMPEEYRDAFDQLVLYPTQASANLYEMYYAVAMNHDLYEKSDREANLWADKARECFERDSVLTYHYNRVMAGGKWNHMMDQVRIGYTIWQQPPHNIMPEVYYVEEQGPTPAVFAAKDGYVSIEAGSTLSRSASEGDRWIEIPNMGKTVSGLTTMPVTAAPGSDTWLEYGFETTESGTAEVHVLVSPTLNFNENRGLSYAVSIDGGPEQTVNINGDYDHRQMERWQAASINGSVTRHEITSPGRHTLRFQPLDPGIVLQKIMIDMGGLRPSYLGPPESERIER